MVSKNNEIKKDYPDDSAGNLMIKSVPTILESKKIKDIIYLLENGSSHFESIDYVYVLDKKNVLKGVLSIKGIFSKDKDELIKNHLAEKLVCVDEYTDQEEIALLALKQNLKAIPVVDSTQRFLGIINHNTLLRILDTEAVEDVLNFGGVSYKGTVDDVMTLSTFTSIKHRLPWLIIGLLGGLIIAGVIGSFEEVLSQNIILASFIPVLVYMSDAIGTQMQAFVIRDLSTHKELNFLEYLFKQSLVILFIGFVVSLLLYIFSLFLHQNPTISLVLGASLFFGSASSLLSGLIVPYTFSKFDIDPANVSGPIATTLQDLFSVLIYFLVATALL